MNLLEAHTTHSSSLFTTDIFTKKNSHFITIEKELHFIHDQVTMTTQDMKNILRNVNVFEDLNILRVIEMTEKIYDFDKFNFNDLMTDTQNIEVELFRDSVD